LTPRTFLLPFLPNSRQRQATLRSGEREQKQKEIARKAEATFHRREFAVSPDAVLEFVAMSGCTAYDCEFVALADVHQVPPVAVDRRILKAFPKLAISLERFVRD
jgi:predicted nucleic acid-binding protein